MALFLFGVTGLLLLVPLPVPHGSLIGFLLAAPVYLAFVGCWFFARPLVAVLFHLLERRGYGKAASGADLPSVSVIIPAYNEEKIIESSVRSVLDQRYPGDIEIIVVDDGSTDETWEILRRMAAEFDPVHAFTQENQGAGTAQNNALSEAENEIVIKLDADTTLFDEALVEIAEPFTDPEVVGVGGNVHVLNDEASWITKIQSMEYALSMEIGRMFQSRLRYLLCISGAFGAFRRETLEEVGGWVADPRYGEDFDITVRLQKHGTVWFNHRAIALTDAPPTARIWAKQRYRWTRNGLRTILLHWKVLLNPRFGVAGLVGLPLKLVLLVVLVTQQVGYLLLLLGWQIGLLRTTLQGVFVLLGFVTATAALFLFAVSILVFTYEKPARHAAYLPAYCFVYGPVHTGLRTVGTVIGLISIAAATVKEALPARREYDPE